MANIIRKDPFFELTSLQDRVNQLFRQAFSGFEGFGLDQPITSPSFLPPVDILEDEHNIKLKAEIPGVKVEDLGVTLENNVLTISGERKFEKEEKEENFRRVERRYGSFVRSFTLPNTVNTEDVTADYSNGVLKVKLAKRAEAKPKQIKVNIGQALANKN